MRDAVDAMADFGVGIGQFVGRLQAALIGFQVCAAVVGAEGARGRDGDEDALRVGRIEQDRVQAHAAGAGLPEIAFGARAGRAVPARSVPPSVA